MITSGVFGKVGSTRIIVVFLALLLAYGAVSYTLQAAAPAKLYSVNLGGVTGTTNNTMLAYGRFVLVAPYWPSAGVNAKGELALTQLNNDSLLVIDTKKPDAPPLSKRLASADSSSIVYFPTRILFDPPSKNVYVRGTRFEEKDGEVTPIDVIAYLHVNLDDTGKPVLDSNVVTFDIPGVSTEHTSEAPLDFAMNGKGDTLVFTNGASLFSFTLADGIINRADIVEPSKYSKDDSISFLNVDSATNVVSVCENRKDKVAGVTSEISFFRLGEHGTFEPLKRAYPNQLPDGIALADGSNIAIVSDADSEFSLFVTNEGLLCTVDLSSDGALATVKRLYTFPELAQSSPTEPNPLLIQYDAANRVIGIVKPGFTAQISRPTNGKPGKISRPTNLHITSETSVLAMASLSKRNKVTSVVSFAQDFKDEGGLSNVVIWENSQWLISTYSGKLYSVGIGTDLQNSMLHLIGPIGSRVDRIDYYSDRGSVVAISSFTLDKGGIQMDAPGSLVVAKLSNLQSQSGGAVLQALLPTASALARATPSIRRPCNIRR